MNTQALLVLDTRYLRKDKTYPIILRLIHNRESTQIKLGVHVTQNDWDDEKRCIKKSYRGTESVTRLNNQLQKKKTEATDLIRSLDELKTLDSYTVYQIRDLIEKKSSKSSFFQYGQELIADMIEAKQIGNARCYKTALGVLKTFCKGKDLTFQQFNLPFILKFETYHFSRGNSLNGLSNYLRTYRAIFNKAIKAKLVDKSLYPFTDYTIGSSKTQKRSLSFDRLQKIINLTFDQDHSLYDARNYFLLSFYSRGMPFADLAQLKRKNIVEGRIYYQRQKSDKPYNIKITKEIESILSLYIKDQKPDDYIFPIIHRETPIDQYHDVEWARKRLNKKLKEIATLCGITENLTSYVSRHSFATRAKNLGVPIATISDMLGHSDTRTTQIYLDTLPSDLIDDAHEKIIR